MKPHLLSLVPPLLLSAGAFAEPTLYPTDLNVLSSVANTTNSNLLADATDSHTVWVMPPNTATATVSGLHTRTANLGFCAELGDIQKYSRELTGEIKKLELKRVKAADELQAETDRASALNEDAQKYAAESDLQALSDLDTRVRDAETRLADLQKAAETCTQGCESIEQESKDLIDAKRVMLHDRNDLARANTADIREYEKRKRKADAAFKGVSVKKAAYVELRADLNHVRTAFLDSYTGFSKMEGARASIRYVSSWDDNVTKLRAANPGFNFAKTATKDARLMTELSSVSDLDPSGAIKAIGVAGTFKEGVAEYPAYPESLQSNVVLSLLGACPMEHPEYFDLRANQVESMEYGVIITYDYDTVFTLKATAKYNMFKMYQKIVESGSKGGFFSSRSWSNVEERNFFRDSFILEWHDEENVLTPAEREVFEQDLRHNVMVRLATQALPQSPARADVLAAAQPPTRGAMVVSDSLIKACPGNAYCMAGAAVFRILDAIFGSSKSTQSYTNIHDVALEDNYARSLKVTKSWLTSYVH